MQSAEGSARESFDVAEGALAFASILPIQEYASIVEDELRKGADLSVIALVDRLIERAYAARASDVHLDPRVDGTTVRLRIDGVLHDAHILPLAIHSEIISRVKILSGLRTDEHQAAQDGRFRVVIGGGSVDVRVSIVPTYWGENVVLRLLADSAEEFSLATLGFTPQNQHKIVRAIRKPHGMILATGPTGSGKTTTLYTVLKMLNVPDVSIITIEDPIEYAIPGVNQIQVNARTGLSFANGLRSILRQDPNVIMVGEIRDIETAGLAINTALTGHLVLSTVHTNDAPTTLPRLQDMKAESYLLASTINVAIGQRLVRKICSGCKQEQPLSEVERKSVIEVMPEMQSIARAFFHGAGCTLCGGTGYWGRIGVHEVMEIETSIRDAVLRKASAGEIKARAIAAGMIPMISDGFQKALLGITTIEEVLRMHYE
jgi:type II secretory ATPase GspE/PulE/Tfp pilus assembly ATPase PilB-like protein